MAARNWRRIVGTWQLLGGAVGAVTFVDRTRAMAGGQGAQAGVLAVMLPLCALFALSGWALVRGHAAAQARAWATALWLPQVVGFRVGEVAYRLAVAPYVMMNVVPGDGVGLSAALRPHLVLYTHTPGAQGSWLTINLLALFALACLWRPTREPTGPPAPDASRPHEAAV